MADLTVTATKVGVPFPHDARIRSQIAGAALNGGVCVYVDSSGKAQLSSGTTAAKATFKGIAIPRMNTGYAAGSGQAVEIVEEGEVEGFDLSGLAYGALVYVSDTDGALADAAGTHSAVVGCVVATSEYDSSGNPKKLLRIFSDPRTVVS